MDLKVSIIQSYLHWENVDENLTMFSEKIDTISETTDIIVLPEMFNTGFSMLSEKFAETMNGKSVEWMAAQSKKADAVITGSLIIQENNNFYNRLVWVQPDGKLYTYDKRHLFRMGDEHLSFSAGKERLIVTYKGWRFCPMICYDLRFPVWARNTNFCHPEPVEAQTTNAYDCLIYVANWPEARKKPWSKLLEARAIENQCYVIGVNRIGEDGNGIPCSGNSVIIDPKGEVISNIPENENCTQTRTLSLDELNSFREAFPVTKDGDQFEIIR
jgi:omega-amidase